MVVHVLLPTSIENIFQLRLLAHYTSSSLQLQVYCPPCPEYNMLDQYPYFTISFHPHNVELIVWLQTVGGFSYVC